MAKKLNVSLKHVQIDKANTAVVITTAIAAFVLVFTGFAVHALWNLRQYQSQVISEKEATRDLLEENLETAESLESSYRAFISPPRNIIGGNSEGQGPQDGDNARIILDALPSRYDFPALITSIETILATEDVTIDSIAGSDEELLQRDLATDMPVEIPFGVNVSASYAGVQSLTDSFERSIRPFSIDRFSLQGEENAMRLQVQLHTYFQPEKRFEVERQELLP